MHKKPDLYFIFSLQYLANNNELVDAFETGIDEALYSHTKTLF